MHGRMFRDGIGRQGHRGQRAAPERGPGDGDTASNASQFHFQGGGRVRMKKGDAAALRNGGLAMAERAAAKSNGKKPRGSGGARGAARATATPPAWYSPRGAGMAAKNGTQAGRGPGAQGIAVKCGEGSVATRRNEARWYFMAGARAKVWQRAGRRGPACLAVHLTTAAKQRGHGAGGELEATGGGGGAQGRWACSEGGGLLRRGLSQRRRRGPRTPCALRSRRAACQPWSRWRRTRPPPGRRGTAGTTAGA